MAPYSPPARRPLPQPVDSSKRTQRRFAPDPLETSTRSNRRPPGQEQSADDAPTGRRRILPQPLESSARSSKKQDQPSNKTSSAASDVISPCRRSLPQPIESSTSSSKARKFAPQLVETTSRQRKQALDTDPAEHTPGDATDLLRHLRIPRPGGTTPIPPVNSPIATTGQVPQLHESRFSYASLSRRASLDTPDRRHSFHVPELPNIPSESEDSNDSTCSSLSATPSFGSDETDFIKNKKKHDEKRSGHLLSLAAPEVEKQLREQVMAAYPNERFYEPVDHFAIDREDDSDKEGDGVGLLSRNAMDPAPGGSGNITPSSRQGSHAGWDVAEVRKHKETLERQRKERDQAASVDRNRSMKEPAREHPHHEHHHGHHREQHHHKRHPSRPEKQDAQGNVIGGHQKDDQMKPMHKAASPPMAGQDLKFPKCQSPRQTRLDVGQYPAAPSHIRAPRSREHSGLWTPQSGASRQNSKSGLWMGVCALSAQKPHCPQMIQTGLLTPTVENDDPFASNDNDDNVQTSSAQQQQQQFPPSPPPSIGSNNSSLQTPSSCLDSVLALERSISEEFHDGFVTQVYNYLSLGYPALARKYDDELSKISRVPVESLRQDDANTNTKGYVGAPEGTGCDLRGMQEGACERWTALRLYVREWARQQPRMMIAREGGVGEDWGARARKGSWAI
ncbi:MAG: hypothetical protein LQ338_003458 [Usnochroma carphineum]|nr:MAG: hypothetical protein LQ338_003458 [Usnochroma carphineum]